MDIGIRCLEALCRSEECGMVLHGVQACDQADDDGVPRYIQFPTDFRAGLGIGVKTCDIKTIGDDLPAFGAVADTCMKAFPGI